MKPGTITAVVFLTVCLGHVTAYPDQLQRQPSEIAGEVLKISGPASFFSPGEQVSLKIDPALIVKGDRLDIYEIGAGKLNSKNNQPFKRVGGLVVTSNSNESPAGRVGNVSKEIEGRALIAFTLLKRVQLSRYLPFLQSLADLFLDKPGHRPLNLAVIDITNPYGHRTNISDTVLKDVKADICGRPQFKCVGEWIISRILRLNRANTSRGVDRLIKQNLLSHLKVDVLVTGRIKRTDTGVDLLLRARSASEKIKPGQVWRRFTFTTAELKIDKYAEEVVTARYVEPKLGSLKIKLKRVDSVEGLKAEYFFYDKLSELTGDHQLISEEIVALDYFIKVDGKMSRPGADSVFYDDYVTAGPHFVTIGFRPAIRSGGVTDKFSGVLMSKTIKIEVGQGDSYNLDVMGTVESGLAIIAVDAYLGDDPVKLIRRTQAGSLRAIGKKK